MKVKVLSLSGPMKINVRPLDWEKDYSDLKQYIELHFSSDDVEAHYEERKEHHTIGDSVCCQWKGQWFRAVLLGLILQGTIKDHDDITKWLARLVDNGQVIEVAHGQIRDCPQELLQLPARSFCCHLDGVMFGDSLVKDDKLLDIVSALPESRVRFLLIYPRLK